MLRHSKAVILFLFVFLRNQGINAWRNNFFLLTFLSKIASSIKHSCSHYYNCWLHPLRTGSPIVVRSDIYRIWQMFCQCYAGCWIIFYCELLSAGPYAMYAILAFDHRLLGEVEVQKPSCQTAWQCTLVIVFTLLSLCFAKCILKAWAAAAQILHGVKMFPVK